MRTVLRSGPALLFAAGVLAGCSQSDAPPLTVAAGPGEVVLKVPGMT
jgi:hypothetical protein